ncbi:DUF4352 domain-containing protein [Streptomyces sp. RFCAC02]|uniref:DUF4352 domain-containing protein n=1 Tax=Streptomyces sp. RFCAC02 TaxID=2499143 RepID=UPI0010204CEE|nr:DUF4352 domain-containing protein [Streptomyces sp. RFCAC02]
MVRTRRRMTAVAALTVAALTMGGALTACSSDDEGDSGTSSEQTTQEDSSEDKPAEEEAAEEEPAEDAPAEDPADDGTLAADETATFTGDVNITLSAPEEYTPDEFAIGHTEGNQPYVVTITIENAGTEAYDTEMLLATARAGEDGVEAEEIFDDTVGGFVGTLPPGQTGTGQLAFDVPPDTAELNVQIEDIADFESSGHFWTLTF